MENFNVKLVLINDYNKGKENGTEKIVSCYCSKNNIEEIKNYITDSYELNLDDMWEIKEIL